MKLSLPARLILWSIMGFGLAFIYVPLILVVINSFNTSTSFAWPPSGFTSNWWQKAAVNEGVREAISRSLLVAAIATLIALTQPQQVLWSRHHLFTFCFAHRPSWNCDGNCVKQCLHEFLG